MLAEIFLLRMEAIYRASEESAPTGNSRFVPITVSRSSVLEIPALLRQPLPPKRGLVQATMWESSKPHMRPRGARQRGL